MSKKLNVTDISHTIFILSQISMLEKTRKILYEDLIAMIEDEVWHIQNKKLKKVWITS